MAKKIDIEELFNSGAHLGHNANKWNPKMVNYIHSKRKNTHIINLERTVVNLDSATGALKDIVKNGGEVIFVATKPQIKEVIQNAAEACGAGFVVERWLGGMLTNKNTMQERVKRLKTLQAKMESGELVKRYSKLEVQRFQEELDGLNKIFGGIKDLERAPAAVVIFDARTNSLAVKEAKKVKATVIAVCDSNVDPTGIDYVIPANDDSTKTIELIAEYFKDAVEAGNLAAGQKAESKDKEPTKES